MTTILSLEPPRQDISVRRGDGIRFAVTVTNADSGAPIDLSTAAIWCTAKRDLADADADAVFQVTKADGLITVDGADNNVAHVLVPAEDTVGLLRTTTLFYDVQIKGPAVQDEPQTVVWGMLTISLDVTRAVV